MRNDQSQDSTSAIPDGVSIRPAQYRALKRKIQLGLAQFAEIGRSLLEIRDSRGYLYDHYSSFEGFLAGEFGISPRRGYQLLDEARICTLVHIRELPVPANESHARELVPLLPPDPYRPASVGRPIEWRPDLPDHLIDTWRFITKDNDEPITAAVIKKWVRHKLAEVRPEQHAPSLPIGVFGSIVADPPWPIEKIQRDERPNQHVIDYPTMTLEAIKDLAPEVMSRSADDAHLYLWTTHKHLPDALTIMGAWGFHYQCVLTWVKNVGFTPFSWMYSTELVLFGRRGNLPLLRNGVRLDFSAPTVGHSVKPDIFYDIVQAVSPGPHLELFARTARSGFTSWGNDPRGMG